MSKEKTIEEQMEELYTNIVMLRASGYNDEDQKTKLRIRQALQECDRIAEERGTAKGKNKVIEELRLRDMPDKDGAYPVYTAIEMSRYLARENGEAQREASRRNLTGWNKKKQYV